MTLGTSAWMLDRVFVLFAAFCAICLLVVLIVIIILACMGAKVLLSFEAWCEIQVLDRTAMKAPESFASRSSGEQLQISATEWSTDVSAPARIFRIKVVC